MEDDLQRSAIEDQIANFGQTPIQIFRKKHPRRGPPIPIAHPLYFAPGSINLTSIVSSTSSPTSAVLYVGILDSNIVLVNQGLTMSVKMWLTTQLQSGGNFTFSGSQVELLYSVQLQWKSLRCLCPHSYLWNFCRILFLGLVLTSFLLEKLEVLWLNILNSERNALQ